MRPAIIALITILAATACVSPKISLFPDTTAALKEYTLEGKRKGKVLVIPVRGMISDNPKDGYLQSKPSMVQEIVSQLRLAEKDKDIKAILLKIDSPGGTITASDLLYHEILEFKERTGAKVVAAMMGVAASGGYYIALTADYIVAHPTTVTGSIGVIFIRPKVTGLMGKIGLEVEVNKSGKNKDMGSPFRQTTEEEQRILGGLIDVLGGKFLQLVARHRKLDEKALGEISTARVYLAEEALQLGLVDRVGYLSEAVRRAKDLAQLPEEAKVVVYRRSKYNDDNIYNTALNRYDGDRAHLIDLGLADVLSSLRTGFYYLWLPAAGID